MKTTLKQHRFSSTIFRWEKVGLVKSFKEKKGRIRIDVVQLDVLAG